MPAAHRAMPRRRCSRVRGRNKVTCSSCRAAPAVQLLPCSSCRAAPAVQLLLPCSSCRAAPAVQLLPCSSCRAASAGSASTGRQRWSRHERSARALRAAAPGAKTPRHGRSARALRCRQNSANPDSRPAHSAAARRAAAAARPRDSCPALLPPSPQPVHGTASRGLGMYALSVSHRGVAVLAPFHRPPDVTMTDMIRVLR